MEPQRFVVAMDASFGEHHQLLPPLQQIHRKPQAGQGGTALIHRKAAQPLQQPSLGSRHLVAGHHEAAIPPGHTTSGRMGQQQGVPAGPVGWRQQNRTRAGQMLATPHHHLGEETRQGHVLGEHRGEWRQPGADAVADTALTGRNQSATGTAFDRRTGKSRSLQGAGADGRHRGLDGRALDRHGRRKNGWDPR